MAGLILNDPSRFCTALGKIAGMYFCQCVIKKGHHLFCARDSNTQKREDYKTECQAPEY